MAPNPSRSRCALAGHGPSPQCRGPLAVPAHSLGMQSRRGIAQRFPAPGTGFLTFQGGGRGCEPGTVLPPMSWVFLWIQGFFCGFRVFSPPLPLFKLPFENRFCFFPPAPAKLLSTKGVTK